jgi:predicted nucleic acid-binding protein
MDSVYIETTIISYLVSRPSRDLLVAAHQQITQEWWDRQREQFECYISQVVIDEVQAGDDEAAARRMETIRVFPVLEATTKAEGLTGIIVEAGAIPKQAVRDAAHIAIAAVNSIDYLLTWNCRHLANAQIIRAVSAVCAAHGYGIPVICTPEELMGV